MNAIVKDLKPRQLQRYQRESRKHPDTAPEIPIMAKLEAAIDVASQDRPTMTTFISRMQQLEIDVRPYITEKGRKRIGYRLGDFKVRGSKLHNGSFPKLLSERGINFDEIRDTPALEAACQGRSLEIDNKQSLLDAVAYGTKALAACDPQDTEPNGSKSLRNAGALAPSASLSWEQIDLHYWLPQPLKALANVYLAEKVQEIPDPKQWHNLQKTLLVRYGIPEHISDGLNEAGLLDASAKGEPIWHRQSLLGSKDSHFWFEIGGTGDRVKKMIVTSSPVEAISAYLVDRLVDREDCPCLYLSLDRLGQLTELDLTKFNSVVVNNSDEKLVSNSVRGLIIQRDVSSWQQSWLAHWNKVETIFKSEAKNNNTLRERKPSNCKQLEL